MKARLGYIAAFAVGIATVAVPAGAATLITGSDIRDGSVTSADVKNDNLTGRDVKDGTLGSGDVKNGSILARDLAPSLRGSPVTVYKASSVEVPAFAQTNAAGGASTIEITVTRPGDLLILSSRSATVTENSTSNITAALYIDSTGVVGSAALGLSFNSCFSPEAPCPRATADLTLDGLVIPDVTVGTHTLSLRYTSANVLPAAHTGSLPTITVAELG